MNNDIQTFRKEKDALFQDGEESPLTHEQKHNFTGLIYFPYDDRFRFENLALVRASDMSPLGIQTSTGDVEQYIRKGTITFTIEEIPCTLTIFQGEEGKLFVPFRDETNKTETYPSGRYVQVDEHDGKVSVDFNYAYNPYCAYNAQWSCPLTPAENNLKAAISAGEKKFHE